MDKRRRERCQAAGGPDAAGRMEGERGQVIGGEGVTTLHFVPSMLQAFSGAGGLAFALPHGLR